MKYGMIMAQEWVGKAKIPALQSHPYCQQIQNLHSYIDIEMQTLRYYNQS